MTTFNLRLIIKQTVIDALILTSGNRAKSARLLGVSIKTVRNYMHRYKLFKRFPSPTNNNGKSKHSRALSLSK